MLLGGRRSCATSALFITTLFLPFANLEKVRDKSEERKKKDSRREKKN